MLRIAFMLTVSTITCAVLAGCQSGAQPFAVIEPDYSYVRHGPSTGDDVATRVTTADADQ